VMTTATSLTFLRIALIPVFVAFFYLPVSWSNVAVTAIFSIAAITDWLDGYLARKMNQTSAFGAFLDPVADKLMVAAALVLLVEASATAWMAVPAVIIIGREIAVSALREWMAEIGQGNIVAVNMWGKVKTAAQITAIILLLYREPLFGVIPTEMLGYIALYIAAALTLWSMWEYMRKAWPILRDA
jgi:CDP-diacylglycerol--glycerol-3-phosphate 3-phosphatidyltransferase